ISIARGIGRLNDPDRFPAFAFKILHRRCVDAIRKMSKERDQSASASHGDHQSTDSQPEGSVDDRPQMHHRMAISEAFAALPNDQRLTAILFFAEGMTLKEISEATDVPIGTVKSRVFHARQKLKTLLEGEKDDHII
ncbi:MAG: sigma-70 family RNA polymerase sigma factor, partial [Pseudomonadota bacterium]